ncbi:hypothetical protein [Luteimonas sp. A478]
MSGGASIFEYMYRDGGNFKTFGQLRLTGWDEQADAKVRLCLELDGQFVAEQVGVPSLCMKHWEVVEDGPSDLDHAFHEFVCLRQPKDTDSDLPVWGSLDTMLARMQGAARRWDVRLSPNCDL